MTRRNTLRLQEVEFVPKPLEEGILYHSATYGSAIHLCACGCGNKTVTPLGENGWTLTPGPTLRPSIGNLKICGSHYYVTDGRIDWL
jgi:hypothetical protein